MATGDKLPHSWEVELEFHGHEGQVRRRVGEGKGLSRGLTNKKGEVICGCDGTSASVRACLASSLILLSPPGREGFDAADRKTLVEPGPKSSLPHIERVKTCAMLGLERVAGTRK